jgi:hypothetical protein
VTEWDNGAGLKLPENAATIEPVVVVPRRSLEMEHRQLIARLQELRKLLGYPPLLTGKERRR